MENKELFIETLLSKMSLRDKIGQVTLIPYNGEEIEDFFSVIEKIRPGALILAGSALAGSDKQKELHRKKIDALQNYSIKMNGIPLLFGRDVIHGHKGTIKDIIATVSYSLIPYLVSQLIKIVLTNLLVPSESVFITIVTTIGLLWTISVMFLGLMTIHEYSVGKTVISILLTFVGIIIIVFIVILLYSLIQQLTNFISSVYREIIFRI